MEKRFMAAVDMHDSVNVYGEPLESCSDEPVTGFYRDGKCNTCEEDLGSHTVCIKVNGDFLEFSRARGNDLTTPMPQFGFAGLKPGDSWCLPGDLEHSAEALEDSIIIEVFSPVREYYLS